MRTIFTVSVSLAIGAALGVGVMTALERSEIPPITSNTTTQIATTRPETLSTADFGAVLLTRVARSFVGDSRHTSSPDSGIAFYTQPLPYASILCRVDLVSVPARIVQDMTGTTEKFVDDIAIERAYAVWRNPVELDRTGGDRDTACAEWRDFETLIRGEPGIFAERTLYLLESASIRARSGKPGFAITCVNRDGQSATQCDGLKLLSEAGYRRVRWMKGTDDVTKTGSLHLDIIGVEPTEPSGYHPVAIEIRIKSVQRAGVHDHGRFEIQSVEVERSVL